MSYGGIEKLLGTTILHATERDGSLYILTDRGLYRGEPEGDCCANCYIQHISGTDALAPGAIVTNVEHIELPPIPEEDQHEVSDVWGHRITTTKGVCSIEMRVDHNGYYGGSLNFTVTETWPVTAGVHEDCATHPELGRSCGCIGKVLDDY